MTIFLRSGAHAVSQHDSMKPIAHTSDPGGPERMGLPSGDNRLFQWLNIRFQNPDHTPVQGHFLNKIFARF
jgi:hypothetical protein